MRAVTSVRLSEPVDGSGFRPEASATWTGTDENGEEFGGTLEIGQTQDSYRMVRLRGEPHVVLVNESSVSAILDASAEELSDVPDMNPAAP